MAVLRATCGHANPFSRLGVLGREHAKHHASGITLDTLHDDGRWPTTDAVIADLFDVRFAKLSSAHRSLHRTAF